MPIEGPCEEQEEDMPQDFDPLRISKFMSLVLRHKPETVGLSLDDGGWVDVDRLLEAFRSNGRPVTREQIDAVVAGNDKKRFAFDETGARIRAVQGHSRTVDLGYQPSVPPELLFHGTVARFLDSIFEKGLVPGDRQHVHLSPDVATATTVGKRRGAPVILQVAAGAMYAAGHEFLRADNGVWLTGHVPCTFLSRHDFSHSP